MSGRVVLRPLTPGEFADPLSSDSPYDDFGPRPGHTGPQPCRLDDAGRLAVEVDGDLAGFVSWRWQQWGPNAGSRCAMIGIWLQADSRGRGIGAQAQRQLADLFFRHTTTNRVEAHTDVNNVAERKALEKAGFTREGIVRGGQWRDGRYRDGFLYSMLREEWSRWSDASG